MAFTAIGCAGLLFASPVWVGVRVTCVLGSLAASYLGILLLRKSPQAFSIGFALFGTLYLFACWRPQTGTMISPVFEQLHETVKREIVEQKTGDDIFSGRPVAYVISTDIPLKSDFVSFAQMLSVVVASFVGGLIARYFYSVRQKQQAKAGEHTV